MQFRKKLQQVDPNIIFAVVFYFKIAINLSDTKDSDAIARLLAHGRSHRITHERGYGIVMAPKESQKGELW